ncbi:MAG: hypothetical protein L3J41_07100 [Melioribacteraceae bacterium]|nr:hypothetical protein [Melioribacteraceae bacterium]
MSTRQNLSFVFFILIMLFYFVPTRYLIAQQNVTPPLLMQQNKTPVAPPAGPGIPPTPPGNPLLPLGQAGIPIVQTIPTQTLLSNLQQAITTTSNLEKLLSAGKVWFMRSPTGEIEIKGGVLYQGAVVAVLHFNPLDGSVLPLGINPQAFQNNVEINSIKSNLSSVIGNLRILPAAEFMEPEACWSFPVVIGNIIVAHIKVYYDGIHVMEDYITNQEMAFYGQ